MKQLSIRLTDEQWKWIAKAAVEQMTTQKELVLKALEEFLKKEKGKNE